MPNVAENEKSIAALATQAIVALQNCSFTVLLACENQILRYCTANLGHIRTENPAEKHITISWAYKDLKQI